jgi:hypothetical protein
LKKKSSPKEKSSQLDQIKKPLVDELLFGRLSQGGSVSVDYLEGEFKFQFKSAPGSGSNLAPERLLPSKSSSKKKQTESSGSN